MKIVPAPVRCVGPRVALAAGPMKIAAFVVDLGGRRGRDRIEEIGGGFSLVRGFVEGNDGFESVC